MKGLKLKCFGLLSLFFIIFGLSLNASSEASAIDFSYSGNAGYSSATIYTNSSSYSMPTSPVTWIGTVSGSQRISSVRLCPNANIPANSIATISFYHISDGSFVPFLLTQGTSSYTVLGNTSAEYGRSTATLYFDSAVSGCFYLYANSNYLAGNSRLDISAISYVALEDEPSALLLQAIESNLANRLGYLHDDLTELKTLIRNSENSVIADNTDRAADVAEEEQAKDEQDRGNIESQQSDSQSGADDSQAEAEATGTTLLAAFTGFVGALTSASPSNCNIDMDLGNLDLGVVNLCQLSLPQPFPTIASIMLILFCVPLSIATARKVINLFRSFQ